MELALSGKNAVSIASVTCRFQCAYPGVTLP